MELHDCPLTPSQFEVIEMSVRHKTTNAKQLAGLLNRSHHTVRTQFMQIIEELGVDSRTGALLISLERGWVSLNRDIRLDIAA